VFIVAYITLKVQFEIKLWHILHNAPQFHNPNFKLRFWGFLGICLYAYGCSMFLQNSCFGSCSITLKKAVSRTQVLFLKNTLCRGSSPWMWWQCSLFKELFAEASFRRQPPGSYWFDTSCHYFNLRVQGFVISCCPWCTELSQTFYCTQWDMFNESSWP